MKETYLQNIKLSSEIIVFDQETREGELAITNKHNTLGVVFKVAPFLISDKSNQTKYNWRQTCKRIYQTPSQGGHQFQNLSQFSKLLFEYRPLNKWKPSKTMINFSYNSWIYKVMRLVVRKFKAFGRPIRIILPIYSTDMDAIEFLWILPAKD